MGIALVTAACTDAGASGDPANRGYHGLVLPEPLDKPDVTLLDTGGRPFSLRAETEGKLTLLFIGYTHCPDVCPVHMANIAAVMKMQPELADRSRVLFVTADPERDTAERIRTWLDQFHTEFVGLRGSAEEVHRVEAALRLPRSVVPTPAGADYVVGHAGQVIAFSPHDNRAHVVFSFGTRQHQYAQDLPRLLRDTFPEHLSSVPAGPGR